VFTIVNKYIEEWKVEEIKYYLLLTELFADTPACVEKLLNTLVRDISADTTAFVKISADTPAFVKFLVNKRLDLFYSIPIFRPCDKMGLCDQEDSRIFWSHAHLCDQARCVVSPSCPLLQIDWNVFCSDLHDPVHGSNWQRLSQQITKHQRSIYVPTSKPLFDGQFKGSFSVAMTPTVWALMIQGIKIMLL